MEQQKERYQPRRASSAPASATVRKKTKKNTRKKTSPLIPILAILLVLGGYTALCASVNTEQILPKTRIVYQLAQQDKKASATDSSAAPAGQEAALTLAPVDVSGLSEADAAALLEDNFHQCYDNQTMTVTANGGTYTVSVGNALSLDTAALAEQAIAPSRAPFFRRGLSRLKSVFARTNVPALPVVGSEEQLRANIQDSGLMDIDTTVQTTYKVEDKQLVLVKGKTGHSVDQDGLVQQISAAVEAGDYHTVIESAMLTGQVNSMDWEKVQKKVCKTPKNATLKLSDNRRDYDIVEAVTGVSFDVDAAQKALEAAPEGGTVKQALKYKAPKITTKKLKKNLFTDKLGTYTTKVSGTWNRISNVRLAAEKCNGIILCNGDSFSYNKTLGERTAANGFKTAGAYLNGTTVQEYGGGICQISSTLYSATLNANLQIDERHNHTFASSYIGLGMDATVSWGGPDFQFTNDKDYPIKIEASYWNGYATVNIWGTKTDKLTVEITSDTQEVIPFKTIYQNDSSLYVGETRVAQRGSDGYKVQTYRKIYDDGKKVSSNKEAYSVYKPHDQIIYQGTKEKPVVVPPSTDDAAAAGTTGTAGTSGTTGTTGTATKPAG